jgi:carboxylesterase
MSNPILAGADPFCYENGTVACLLTHGFTSSPFEVRELGQYLAGKKLTVHGILLPGHGTSPQDLVKTTWQDWFDALEHRYLQLKEKYRHVIVGGMSMGGSLSLLLAAKYDLDVIMVYAPAVWIPGWRMKIVPFARFFFPKVYRGTADIKNEITRKAIPGYAYAPTESVYQFSKLLKEVRMNLKKIHSPLLIMQSTQDHRIPVSNSELVFHRVSSQIKEIYRVINSYHIITCDNDKQFVFEKSYEFIQRTLLNKLYKQ